MRSRGYHLFQKDSLVLTHLNADLYLLRPSDDFRELKPNLAISLSIECESCGPGDALPNWFVTTPTSVPVVFACMNAGGGIAMLQVPYRSKSSNDRCHSDSYNYGKKQTESIFPEVSDLKTSPNLIFPTPEHIAIAGTLTTHFDTKHWVIVPTKQFRSEARFLSGQYL